MRFYIDKSEQNQIYFFSIQRLWKFQLLKLPNKIVPVQQGYAYTRFSPDIQLNALYLSATTEKQCFQNGHRSRPTLDLKSPCAYEVKEPVNTWTSTAAWRIQSDSTTKTKIKCLTSLITKCIQFNAENVHKIN